MPDTEDAPSKWESTRHSKAVSDRSRRVIKDHGEFWSRVVSGCRVAGAIWPFVLTMTWIGVAAVRQGLDSRTILGITSVLVTTGTCAVFAYFIFSGVASFLARRARGVVGPDFPERQTLAIATLTGGVVGLIGGFITGVLMGLGSVVAMHPSAAQLISLYTIATSTVAAQIGGTCGAWQSLKERRSISTTSKVVRFSTRQLMTATLITSVLLATLKVAGILSETLLLIVGCWISLQILGATIAMAIERRITNSKET